MATKTILRDSFISEGKLNYSIRDISPKFDQKNSFDQMKNSSLSHTKQSLSQSMSFIDNHKLSKKEKSRGRTSIDLWEPLKKFTEDRQAYQISWSKTNQEKSLKDSNLLNSSTSNISSFRSMFSASNIIWKNKRGQVNRVNTQTSIKSASDNFISSFRVVFSELVESFFLQLYLKKKIKYYTYQIWVSILNKSQCDNKDFHEIDIESFSNAIKTIFGNDYRLSQVQNMTLRYFSDFDNIIYEQFQDFMSVQSQFVDFLMERSYEKRFSNYPPQKLVNTFFKSMIEFADLEKKLKLICKANESSAIKVMMDICSGKIIKMSRFAAFLDEQNAQKIAFGLKLSQQKLTIFLQKILERKITKFDLMKWLGIVN